MTITPERGTGAAQAPVHQTLSARNRARRRASAGEPRHDLEELSAPRRRSTGPGRHAVEPRILFGGLAVADDEAVVEGFWDQPITGEVAEEVAGPVVADEAAGAMPLHAGGESAFFDDVSADKAYRIKRKRRAKRGFFAGAVVRCCLYVGPLSVAVAAAPSLRLVAWPVTAVMLLLGWSAAQALTSVGVVAFQRAGEAAAARLVVTGFAAASGIWCALVWIAPASLLGPDRALAATVGVCGLLAMGSVTAALVTRAEGAVAAWYLPCWLLAALACAGSLGVSWAAAVPVETMVPGAIVAVTVRAFRPAVLPGRIGRSRLTVADRRRGLSYMVIGAAQATCVTLLWHGGPADTPLPVVLPVLLAVPMLEALIGWHIERLDAGLDSAEDAAELGRHIRNVTAITLAGFLPPLAAGIGLAVAAFGLPGMRDGVLALAAGTLLGGVFAVTSLLAARFRHGIAATLAVAPPLAAVVIALFPSSNGPLPAAVGVLATAHLAGLLIVALTAADLRRTP
ncbi:hypothetical protein FB565_001892 [Actinoplanes lutulentus]|uniref:Uncharacterized protein n=1 Tax=Actinoplanes lutulentus TaxID=1287878 RepID=A0A327YYZ7_9ACTN|nr:hypothetical protein [Actinoplanes lutulentus]MBB2942179.1 hypothetical protein [Actinoplanes lutulentus]RAK26867.1 hypothetical protein B0I29_12521 [Actinoplanes lutulentus]